VPPPVVVEGEVVAVPVPRPRLTLCHRPSMPDVVERSHGGKREKGERESPMRQLKRERVMEDSTTAWFIISS
jgi:hypothetical protein